MEGEKKSIKMLALIIAVLAVILVYRLVCFISWSDNQASAASVYNDEFCGLQAVVCSNEKTFEISAYNTVPEQTDATPCISASGDNICGRSDVVACPPEYVFGTKFVIDGKMYECLDRTAPKYSHRLDICFGEDVEGAVRFGLQIKNALVLE